MSKVHFHKPRGPQGQNGKWEHKLWTGGLSQESLSPCTSVKPTNLRQWESSRNQFSDYLETTPRGVGHIKGSREELFRIAQDFWYV